MKLATPSHAPNLSFERKVCRRVDDEALKKLWPTRLPDRLLSDELGHDIRVLRRRARQLGLKARRAIWAETVRT